MIINSSVSPSPMANYMSMLNGALKNTGSMRELSQRIPTNPQPLSKIVQQYSSVEIPTRVNPVYKQNIYTSQVNSMARAKLLESYTVPTQSELNNKFDLRS